MFPRLLTRGGAAFVVMLGVATLVFLYISATTLIFGAEVNAVLREKTPGPAAAGDPA